MAQPPNQPAQPAGAGAPGNLPQHPFVERLKPQPAQPPKRVVVLIGMPGNSDRAGYQRLYLTTKLDYYAEFLTADMVLTEAVAAEQSPLPGLETTKVSIARDATIHYVWAQRAQPFDEFDLDIRLGPPGAAPVTPGLPTRVATCFPDGTACRTCDGTCDATCFGQRTCHTCAGQATCVGTCHTCPGQQTCHTCAGQQTCQTCPGQQTCQTCAGQQTCQTCAGQQTCQTCQTCAGQQTCQTCHTCVGQQTCQTCHTCDGTCVDTCHRTCITCIHPHCPPPP
jgi:hypothetical protein